MMKTFILGIILTVSAFSFGQKEGYLQYTIEVEAVDTTLKAKQQEAMLRNSKMEIYFKKNFSRVDFKMGSMYNMTAIVDQKADRVLSLISSPMGKFATRQIASESDTVVSPVDSTTTVEFFEETKVILEYPCKKAIVRQGESETTYWYTEEIQIDLKDQQFVNSSVPGFPMEFFAVNEGVMMHFQASNIVFSLKGKPEDVFSTKIPAGYTLINDVD